MAKLENHYTFRYTGAQQVTTYTSSRTNRFGTRIQGIGINYTSLSIQPLLSQTQYTRLQEKLAAHSVERKIIATSLL